MAEDSTEQSGDFSWNESVVDPLKELWDKYTSGEEEIPGILQAVAPTLVGAGAGGLIGGGRAFLSDERPGETKKERLKRILRDSSIGAGVGGGATAAGHLLYSGLGDALDVASDSGTDGQEDSPGPGSSLLARLGYGSAAGTLASGRVPLVPNKRHNKRLERLNDLFPEDIQLAEGSDTKIPSGDDAKNRDRLLRRAVANGDANLDFITNNNYENALPKDRKSVRNWLGRNYGNGSRQRAIQTMMPNLAGSRHFKKRLAGSGLASLAGFFAPDIIDSMSGRDSEGDNSLFDRFNPIVDPPSEESHFDNWHDPLLKGF